VEIVSNQAIEQAVVEGLGISVLSKSAFGAELISPDNDKTT
jgi:hypothetical protein